MNHFVLAVYDSSPDYINHFLTALKGTGNLPFEITGFTSPSALGKFVSGAVVNILLLSLSGEEAEETEINKILCHENIKKAVYLGEQPIKKSDTEYICKYQSIRGIAADLLRIWNACGYETSGKSISADIYGVYSLENPNDRICLSLNLARSLSSTKRVLYIETERFSGLKGSEGNEASGNLSDIIYLYKTNPAKLRQTLPDTITHLYGVDIIKGSNTPEDFDETEPDTWPDIFQTLASEGGYDTLVVGISDSFRNIELIFSLCRSVYLLVVPEHESHENTFSESFSAQRMKEFNLFFEGNERSDILEKIIPIDMNQAAGLRAAGIA